MAVDRLTGQRAIRWRGPADVLAQLRRDPGITRAELARRLQLSSGSATEITSRLRQLCLLIELPAPVQGRGRPTTVFRPHPDGPLALAVELRQEDWRCATVTLDGRLHELEHRRHDSRDSGRVLAAVQSGVARALHRHPGRVRATSVAVAATVRDGRVVQAATLGWGDVDLSGLAQNTGMPLLVGNDATLSGIAEARTGAAAGARTALHLLVEVGVGGTVVIDGQPVAGANGAAGEYGHLPFGDRGRHCPCGARGCWDLEVDGRALARHLDEPAPADPRSYARDVLRRATHDQAAHRAVTVVAAALASGLAGLVNAHDPAVVTIGGLAVALRAAAPTEFSAVYLDGLMAFRRAHPPPVLDARHGDDGALAGAAAVALDAITTDSALTSWAARQHDLRSASVSATDARGPGD